MHASRKQAIKRKCIQIAAFGLSNAHLANIAGGKLYTGPWKQFCNPGLNCYSCPAASLACPIGALAAVGGSMDFRFSFYVAGFLLAVGVLLGRFICGFLCPFGLVQDLIGAIKTPKLHLPHQARYGKYAVLLILVLLLPVAVTNFMGMGKPAFCQWICPSGTLLGGIPLLSARQELRQTIGTLFYVKLSVLVLTLGACVLIDRFFCKAICPLGAVYGLLNKVSLYRLRVEENKCVHCGKCRAACRMDVDPVRTPDSAECIRCGACAAVCPAGAITLRFFPRRAPNPPSPSCSSCASCGACANGKRSSPDK